jgi:hypothetical protein
MQLTHQGHAVRPDEVSARDALKLSAAQSGVDEDRVHPKLIRDVLLYTNTTNGRFGKATISNVLRIISTLKRNVQKRYLNAKKVHF